MVTETTRVTTINFPRNRRFIQKSVSNKRVEFDNVSDRRFFNRKGKCYVFFVVVQIFREKCSGRQRNDGHFETYTGHVENHLGYV